MSYSEFVIRKLSTSPPTGLTALPDLPAGLFPHQVALTNWALRRGRCAIFAEMESHADYEYELLCGQSR